MIRTVSIIFIVLIFAAVSFFPATVYANSAEPPALIVIMKNAPRNVSVSIVSADSVKEGRKSKTAWETYYAFYMHDIGDNQEITLRVSGNNISYDQAVGEQYLKGYNSIITMDFSARTIAAGKLLSRSVLLVAMRVLLTLVIEGGVFFLFGFREKKSWIVFLAMNLLTQGILNIVLNGASPFAGYLIFNLIFMEFWVFLTEITAASIFIKEHGKLRLISCMLAANTASLVVGGYLITVLPV